MGNWKLIEIDLEIGIEYIVPLKYKYRNDLESAIKSYVYDTYEQDVILNISQDDLFIRAKSEEVEYIFYKKY